ncbi:CDP-glucose 4,6-dehydratase [Terriglobus albidus]|uniref:CDP-glucose 4,6-dehydratase n=1 Tax=Terriglobus albidus TaxID=1592106 RepID=UPI0021E0C955|nr:CDP-glucose 4,6-dehydratase [Terriglobus albidus]
MRESLGNFWSGRRVFLTGHTGFKGSWLALWLARLGAHVRGFSLDPDTEPNLFTVARVQDFVEHGVGDIRDFPMLRSALLEYEPEIVFHLAAQSLVRRSYRDPLGTYGTNVMGTANLLEAARQCSSVRAMLCITSDKSYRNDETGKPYLETDPLGGHDPYSSSKACAELVTAAYRASYFAVAPSSAAGVATARAGNVIGGGDWSQDRLIPDVARAISAGEPVHIRNPKAIRPWQHVLEPLYGYMLLTERLVSSPREFSDAFNFGPEFEDTWPVEQIVGSMIALCDNSISCHIDATQIDAMPSEHESGVLRVDADKARRLLDWQPRLRIAEALEWTALWYQQQRRGMDMQAQTLGQIAAYEDRL